jgi:hypothetical protein
MLDAGSTRARTLERAVLATLLRLTEFAIGAVGPHVQIAHQRQDHGKACSVLGQLVCQSAHRLQFTIRRYGPLDVIGERDP